MEEQEGEGGKGIQGRGDHTTQALSSRKVQGLHYGYRVNIKEEAHEIKQAQGQIMEGDSCPVCFCATDRCRRRD